MLNSLRFVSNHDSETNFFNIPEFDALLPKPQPQLATSDPALIQAEQGSDDIWDANSGYSVHVPSIRPARAAEKEVLPIVELISPPSTYHSSGAGKTALLYLLTTIAILPAILSSVPLLGHDAAVIIFDPLSHFSVARLAEVMISHITSYLSSLKPKEEIELLKEEIVSVVKRALVHVHIFRPQSWESLVETLKGLETYLFDSSRHKSTNLRIQSIILENINVFEYNIRSSASTAATSSNAAASTAKANPLTTASQTLTSLLLPLQSLLSCSLILTLHSITPNSLRPSIPSIWPAGVRVTRLAVKKVEVIKFIDGMSMEEAEIERAKRWEVVRRGRFECWKVGGENEGKGFVFRVGRGVEIERVDGS